MWSALGNSPIRLQNDGHSEPQSLNRIIKGRPFGVGCHRCARPPTKGAPSMIGEKYIGLDVHQATISVAVMDSKGKVVMLTELMCLAKRSFKRKSSSAGMLSSPRVC